MQSVKYLPAELVEFKFVEFRYQSKIKTAGYMLRRFDTVHSVFLIYLSGHNGARGVSIYVNCSATQSTALGPGPCFVRPVFRQVPTIKETCIIATRSVRYFLICFHVP